MNKLRLLGHLERGRVRTDFEFDDFARVVQLVEDVPDVFRHNDQLGGNFSFAKIEVNILLGLPGI